MRDFCLTIKYGYDIKILYMKMYRRYFMDEDDEISVPEQDENGIWIDPDGEPHFNEDDCYEEEEENEDRSIDDTSTDEEDDSLDYDLN